MSDGYTPTPLPCHLTHMPHPCCTPTALLAAPAPPTGPLTGDAFGAVVKAEHAKATGSEERQASVSLEGFLSWYPGFMELQAGHIGLRSE